MSVFENLFRLCKKIVSLLFLLKAIDIRKLLFPKIAIMLCCPGNFFAGNL